MARETLGLGKECRSCGVRATTLGSVCPACGQPYLRGGLLDIRVSYAWAAVAAMLAAGELWLLLTQPAVGIVLGAVAFACMVAAIGIVNALAGRRR